LNTTISANRMKSDVLADAEVTGLTTIKGHDNTWPRNQAPFAQETELLIRADNFLCNAWISVSG